MKKWLHWWLLFLVLGFSSAQAKDYPDFTQIVRDHGAAVVNITTTQMTRVRNMGMPGLPDDDMFDFFRRFMPPPGAQDNGGEEVHSGGSGFIISPDGYILTNAHVVDNADEVTVKLTDRREFKAKVIGTDPRSDIALIKIQATGLPVAPIGDPRQLQVGEWVIAIGSPFGFENSVTAGIVSAKNRSLPDNDYVPFIQTDVAVNPGNSGGPLFDMHGQVVGINSQIYSRSGGYMGVSFAIPIDVAMQVADQLRQYGKVRRGRLGVVIQEVSAGSASAFGLDKPAGALVSQVDASGPGARAGLKPGDIILRFNGQPIVRSIDLPRMVANAKPGSIARLDIWRNRAPLALNATLGEMPDKTGNRHARTFPDGKTPDKVGLVVSNLPPDAPADSSGVVVQHSVGAAARAGIQPGDLILAVGDTPVHNVAQYHALVAAAAKYHSIALLIRRDNATLYVTVQTD
ncbi:MAG: DegQ family serine endoprotease [Betaproteobacteria bacterium]|nr:DegQ family serine endoprotease [Betaproteobacteria bacterium]